ncbi:MAG: tetratricopeptide repeat protein [Chlamydiota bacterium]|jgi:tetratricopeptide (TPR) repeat protein
MASSSTSLTSCFLDSTPTEVCGVIASFSDFYTQFQLLELTHERGTSVFQKKTDEIIALAKEKMSPWSSDKIFPSIDLARVYIQLNRTTEAENLLEEVEKQLQNQGRRTRFKVLILLGKMHYQLNNIDTFEKIFQSVENNVLEIKEEWSLDRYEKIDILLLLAHASQKVNKVDQSNKIFQIIKDLIKTTNDDRTKIDYLINLAETKYLLKELDEFKEILKDAEELACHLDSNISKICDLKKIAKLYVKLNMKTEVEPIFQKIKTFASELDFNYSKASTLVHIAEDYPVLGTLDDSLEFLQEAERIYHNVKDTGSNYDRDTHMACKTSSLIEMARIYIKLQRPDEAERILKDAEEIAEILSETSKSSNFLELSKLQAMLGNFDKSAELLKRVSAEWKVAYYERVEAIKKAIAHKKACFLKI